VVGVNSLIIVHSVFSELLDERLVHFGILEFETVVCKATQIRKVIGSIVRQVLPFEYIHRISRTPRSC
jgi:hypothetical protein